MFFYFYKKIIQGSQQNYPTHLEAYLVIKVHRRDACSWGGWGGGGGGADVNCFRV